MTKQTNMRDRYSTTMLFTAVMCALFLFGSCVKNEIVDPPPGETPGNQMDIEWPSLAKSPWPMFGGGPQNTGRSNFSGSALGSVLWSQPVYGTSTNQAMTSPVFGSDSTIYFVGSYAPHAWLNAVRPDGSLKWKADLGALVSLTTPTVLSDNSVVVGTDNGSVILFAPNGDTLWTFNIPFGTIYNDAISVDKDGNLYFVGLDRYLYSLSKTGQLNWKKLIDDGFYGGSNSSITFSPDGTTLYVQGVLNSKALYAIGTDGVVKWTFEAKQYYGLVIVDSNGNIYFGGQSKTGDTTSWNIYSLNSDGSVRWKYS